MAISRDNGKGDLKRPLGVPMDKFDTQWDAIFGKKPKTTDEQEKKDVNQTNGVQET